MTSSSLNGRDRQMLARFGITDELTFDVFRVTDREARDLTGLHKMPGDLAGICYSYNDPNAMMKGERKRWYLRIRRDNPEMKDGRLEKKYICPVADRKHLFFPPTPELLADTSIPIVLVEAEKSVLALVAWSRRIGRKILPIGLGGVYGWKCKVGIKETSTGERVPETGPVPDLNICRDKRLTYVLLDANCRTNPMVQAAKRDLVAQLRKQGAEVRILDLPGGDDVNGPDDFIAVRGDETMRKLFDDEVDGAALLNDIEAYIRQFVVLTSEQADVLAVYVLHTHVIDAGRFTPYIQVWSAVKRSGKSRVLEVLQLLVHKPWKTGRVSAAALVRKIAKIAPTLLLDESDAAFNADNKDYSETLRGILNDGFYRGGCTTVCVKHEGDWDPKDFPVFCPKVIAGIGMNKLPDTVRDRSIPIELKRRAPNERVEDFDTEDEIEAVKPLVERIQKWAQQNGERLKSWPKPGKLSIDDRKRDICNPLLKIADLVGSEWHERVSNAFVSILTDARPDSDVKVLSDIRDAFDHKEVDRISSEDLVSYLNELEGSPWGEFSRGKGITKNRLAILLEPFDIRPDKVRFGDRTLQGYRRERFEDSFNRYLPHDRPEQPEQCPFAGSETPIQPGTQPELEMEQAPVPERSISVPERVPFQKCENPSIHAGCSDVPFQSQKMQVNENSKFEWKGAKYKPNLDPRLYRETK